MQDLIQKLVNDYKADKITWHDIQDIVEGHVAVLHGGVGHTKEEMIAQFKESDKILTIIENKLNNKEVNSMDEFLQDIVECFNTHAPVHADTAEEVVDLLTKTFEAGDVNHPLKFD